MAMSWTFGRRTAAAMAVAAASALLLSSCLLADVRYLASDDLGGRDNGTHHLGATTYHDLRVAWKVPTAVKFEVAAGVNNVFAKDPPVCLSCSLNGYDASTYDLPGRFYYAEASVKF